MDEWEKTVFDGARFDIERLLAYGFARTEDGFSFKRNIMGGAFCLDIAIGAEGEVSTSLIDNETKDLYPLYKIPSAHGEYVGMVRDQVKEVLYDVLRKCCILGYHTSPQFSEVEQYCESTFGEKPEYLWQDENCIFRRADNRKWYAVVMRVALTKLGIEEEGKASVLCFRGDPTDIDMKTVFPGYHLNKKSWISIVLDDRSSVELIHRYLSDSRQRALGKKK